MSATHTAKMIEFVQSLGLPVRRAELTEPTFLPGLALAQGELLVDEARLTWPGDILHEAAHLALAPPSRRSALEGKLQITPAEEMAALAWSYAAAVHLGIEPTVVFHEGGYKLGGGAQLAAQYASGLPPGGPGVPILQWWGLTTAFPRMNHWVRQSEDPT